MESCRPKNLSSPSGPRVAVLSVAGNGALFGEVFLALPSSRYEGISVNSVSPPPWHPWGAP